MNKLNWEKIHTTLIFLLTIITLGLFIKTSNPTWLLVSGIYSILLEIKESKKPKEKEKTGCGCKH